jgi:hypothetical protein
MKSVTVTVRELFFLAGTRALLGAGVALLIVKRLTDQQGKTAGTVLVGIGVLSTVPLALEVLGKVKAGHEIVGG